MIGPTRFCVLAFSWMAAEVVGAPQLSTELLRPMGETANGSLRMRIDHTSMRGLETARPFTLSNITLPDSNQTVDFKLERFTVTKPDTSIEIHRARGASSPFEFDPSQIVLFRGSIENEPGSHVFLAIAPSRVVGRIELGSGRGQYDIRPNDQSPEELLVSPALFPVQGGSDAMLCGEALSGVPPKPQFSLVKPAKSEQPALGTKRVEILIDTDYEFFSLFNDPEEAMTYLVTLYAAISDIYIRDVGASLVISHVRLWDSPTDPYGQIHSVSVLFELRAQWEFQSEFERDLVQLISGRRDLDLGGTAFAGPGACNPSQHYSVVAYVAGFFQSALSPHVFNRDILAAAHEMGHTFNSPHTHDSVLMIDACDSPHSPPRRGTIMSYCQQAFTGGYANGDLRFHTAVQEIIENAIAIEPCFDDDCNLNGIADDEDIARGTSDDENSDGVLDECQDCNGNGVLDPQDIATGDSTDLNGNAVPDDCEPDCNGNGIPDDLDIAQGEPDVHGNGVPDVCETDCNDNGVSDYSEIQLDMSLDLDRNVILDECQDCDGDGLGDISELHGANSVWVVDQEQSDPRHYLWLTGTELPPARSTGALRFPQDLRISPDGRIFVTSCDDDRIAEFDALGNFVGDFAGPGVGGLNAPAAMTFAPYSDLLVANTGGNNVLRFEMDGTPSVFVPPSPNGPIAPFGLALNDDGLLYATTAENEVRRYDGAGQFVDVFITAKDNGGLDEPRGIAFLPNGHLLVASHGTNVVLEFDANGEFIGPFNTPGFIGDPRIETDDRLTLDQPWCIRLGPDGGVYVSRAHDHEKKRSERFGGEDPAALHLTNARIFHYDPTNGSMIRAYVQGADSNLRHPTGFDFFPDFGFDCNRNLIPDNCEITSGRSADSNSNSVPDECECIGDLNEDGIVGFADLLILLASWGGCPPETDCAGDLDASGSVSFNDLLTLLAAWGSC